MGEIVDIARYASARDRKLLVEIVESAQLAQAFATYERSFFMSSPADQRKIAERLATMAAAAAKLSGAVRQRTAQVPWADLIEAGGAARKPDAEPAALWTAVKKVVPRVTSALAPLIQGSAGVFAWTPPPKIRKEAKTTSGARSIRKSGSGRPRAKR